MSESLDFHPTGFPLDFDFPVGPCWWSRPPAGLQQDGIRLSEAVMASLPNLEALHEARARCRVDVEFRID